MTTRTPVPFYRHDLGEPEVRAIAEVLAQPILTTGHVTEAFEKKFAEYLGRRYALAVTSCTGAMHMSLLALGIGPGDEVITTPMTFAATALAIVEAGATPVFVDVEADTGNLDARLVEAKITPRTKAILPVHLYGLMCDMKALRHIADKHGLRIIEDAAHCVEGVRDGIRPGELGDTACFSFYATKNLTCGEGGALVTNDPELHDRLRLIRLHGMTKTAFDRYKEGYKHWDVVLPGWKYNMSNIDAALLLPQLERLDAKLAKREALATYYRQRLSAVSGLRIPAIAPSSVHAWHLFCVWIEGGRRDWMVQELMARGIEVVVNYRAVHLLEYFRQFDRCKPGSFPVAERIGDAALSLPFYPDMRREQIDTVVNAVASLLQAPAPQATG
jgi:dTDP-4-amino-4,6-dideoxygalactose transaminase